MIRILRDEPAKKDGFGKGADGIGPHASIAAAIERRIVSEEGGGTIGLEGDYGSGKSTIVRLLSNQLDKHKNIKLIIFDAWSHEGDPLRRAFLETLINELMDHCDGLIPEKWHREKERLSQRHRKSRETKKSSPSGFGIWVAIATGLVPVGLLVSRAQTSKEDFVLDWDHIKQWPITIGLLLLVAPILVAATRLLFLHLGYILRTSVGWIPRGRANLLKRWTFNCRRVAPRRYWGCFATVNYSFLAQQGTLESESDAYESSDPTSVEFESRFSELISEAIEGTDKRIVLVVDNLDRLTAKQSLAIWSNLQTFVSQRALDGNGWSNQFSLLVPYTPAALQKLWGDAGAVTSAASFFEKTFQVRFTTPPPTLSNWQGHLRSMLREAIPEMPANDMERAIQVFDLVRRERVERIVPRQLKLHVNALAVLWDIWNHNGIRIPASDLAYAVLHSADRSQYEECLRRRIERLPDSERKEEDKECPDFPSKAALRLCGPKLVDHLAAVHFNVEPSEAIQILLWEKIESALNDGELETLSSYRETNEEAFWIVLLGIVEEQVDSLSPEGLTTWVKGLQFLDEDELPYAAEKIRESIREQIGKERMVWHPLSEETIDGLVACLRIDSGAEMRSIVREVGERTARSTNKDIDVIAKLSLVKALREASVVPDNPQRAGTWKVAMEASEWIDVAASSAVDESGFVFIDPICSSESIVQELCERAGSVDDEGRLELKDLHVRAFAELSTIRSGIDGSAICEVLHETLTTKATVPTREAVETVSACIERLHSLRLQGEESASAHLRDDNTARAIFDCWTNADALAIVKESLIASLLYSHPAMDIDKQFGGVADATRNKYKAFCRDGGLEAVEPVWRKLCDYHVRNIVGKLGKQASVAIKVDFIELASNDGDASLAVGTGYVKANSRLLVDRLENRDADVHAVVKQLVQNTDLCASLVENGDPLVDKVRECVEVILDFGPPPSQLVVADAFAKKLGKVSREQWQTDLVEERKLVVLAGKIQNEHSKSFVGSSFKTAMKNVAGDFARGDLELDTEGLAIVASLVSKLSPSLKKDLGKQALANIHSATCGLNSIAVTIYGDAILLADIDFSPEDLATITARSLDGADGELVAWLLEFLIGQDRVLSGVKGEASQLLQSHLEAAEHGTEDEDTHLQLEKLRELFAIYPQTADPSERSDLAEGDKMQVEDTSEDVS
ncbi:MULTISPECIES: P-loop NTPase fold protein [Rhodopirellula]|uniref:P-loop NTPase fold protein n=1 Tax=Rhodopirellula TaxID=265488 RepID=UPI00257F9E84|nr:P-loop NTPase fold protein [Rhodopirellula sp. UBA1907]|tara:strand:+ start:289 stop:3879 length:3591 start_codon:yes stop_codon:yes gene_type:complete